MNSWSSTVVPLGARSGAGRSPAWLGCLAAAGLLASGCLGEDKKCGDVGTDTRRLTGPCIGFDAPVQVGRVQDSLLLEASGLAVSRTHPGVLYTHNDSGDIARFFALDTSGRTLAEFDLPGLAALDWEDVAIGPGPSGSDFLYFADIGDNSLTDPNVLPRNEIEIVRVPEPDVSATQERVLLSLGGWQRIRFTYPDGPHDAEALIADPTGADLWILTKETNGRSNVFSAPASAAAESLSVLTKLGELSIESCGDTRVTAGDISGDGRLILVRTYSEVLLWERKAGATLMQALSTAPHRLRPPQEAQGEALAFAPDARAWFTLGEGRAAPIFRAAADCP